MKISCNQSNALAGQGKDRCSELCSQSQLRARFWSKQSTKSSSQHLVDSNCWHHANDILHFSAHPRRTSDTTYYSGGGLLAEAVLGARPRTRQRPDQAPHLLRGRSCPLPRPVVRSRTGRSVAWRRNHARVSRTTSTRSLFCVGTSACRYRLGEIPRFMAAISRRLEPEELGSTR